MDRVDSGDPRYSTLPQAYDTSGLPEVYYPQPQPQSPQVQSPYSYYNVTPFIETGTKTEPTSAVETVPPQPKLPWWRRYWIFLLVAAIVVAGGLGGGLGGGLASRNSNNNSKSEATSGSDSAGSSSASPTPSATSSSSSGTSAAPSATASVAAHIYLGAVNISDVEWQVGFLPNQPCRYTQIAKTSENKACENPFTLCDTVTYTWHGCGSDTWVTWGDDNDLGDCGLAPRVWTCGDTTVKGTWLCGS